MSDASRTVRVACQQIAPQVGHGPANEAMAEEAIAAALADGADVVVLPELVTSGYVFASRDEALSSALSPDAAVFQTWSALAATRDAVVIGGFPEMTAAGDLYNSAAVVDAGGIRAIYRKCHLWDEEKRWFTPGDAIPPVLDTRFGRIGVLICFDLEFPEFARTLAIRGADLIAVPTNWPSAPHPDGERPAEMIDASSMARLNRVHIACCDRAGSERGVTFAGGSCIIDTHGWMRAERPKRDVGPIVADLDLSRARDKALNQHNHVLGDRRPELYRTLVEPVVLNSD